ncbi:MAG TPA: hypothetical protein VE988_01235, partial [Gemmataceae bacterium]|nr:hypothetical protein [Gemmataceae bacterium]
MQTVFKSCMRVWRRPSAMRDTFVNIYRTNAWGNDQSRSGPGSTVVRTAMLRPQLERLLQELEITTLLDAPCGDFNWLKESVLPVQYYVGVDVVPELIRNNRRMF